MISRRSLLPQLGLLAVGGAGFWLFREKVLWPPPRVVFAEGASSSGWLSWSARDPVPVVRVEIEGQPVEALIDSGAQASVVDQSLARRLGLKSLLPVPVIAFGVSGGPQVGRSVTGSVTAGALKFEGLRAAMLDLRPLSGAAGRPIALVLGMNALAEILLDLDVPRRRLALRGRGEADPPGALALPARASGRALWTTILVEGRPVEAVLDTGASSALALSEPGARTAGLLDGRPSMATTSITFGGRSVNRTVIVERLRVGSETLREVSVQIFPVAGDRALPSGLLGIDAFRRLRVLADFRAGRLLVSPSAPERRNRRVPATMPG